MHRCTWSIFFYQLSKYNQMKWFIKAIRRRHNFRSRARRSEFWYFFLINTLFLGFFVLLDHLLSFTYIGRWYGLLSTIYAIASLKTLIAVGIRRLHDIRRSGYMLILFFLPIFGTIWLIILLAKDGNPRLNIYGDNPKDDLY